MDQHVFDPSASRRLQRAATLCSGPENITLAMNGKNRVEKIRCDEPGCTCVVAERRADGAIVIRARHYGEMHVTIIEPWPSAPRQDLAAEQ
jgi:hypothetical protein